jgi:signal transduction histidine kinase/ActR/RegA family two-component response regulator
MISAPLTRNELERQKALRALSLLDTPAEERFDRLLRVAKNALNIPIAFLNLIDSDRQWCKSAPGNKRESTPRIYSFCAHTILEEGPMTVRDTLQDIRFIDNPLVTGGPCFRSYLGIPLLAENGQPVGSLCVLDVKPRVFTPREIEIALDLAAAVQSELNNVSLNESLEIARLAQRTAEATVRARKEFMATVSHEIRTPMNGIMGMVEILADTELTDAQRSTVDTIRGCTRSLVSLINHVLDFSKIEAGKLQLENIPLDPRVSVEQVLTLNRQAAAAKGISLMLEVDDAVPRTILGDPHRLGQILLNLVGNALKFTASGSITVSLDVIPTPEPQRPLLQVSISDTGVGLSKEAQARLFQAFTQADSSVARRHGGTGLGLVICKQLVEMMGGSISVQSEPGRGSTFTFTIAFSPHLTDATPAPREESSPDGSEPPFRILVAEDNLVNQKVMAHLLGKLHRTAEFVDGGLPCLDLLEKEHFDLVFMDVQMPDLDGLETSRRIRALAHRNGDSPYIVAVTADAMPEDRQKCLAAGMNDYLSKPLSAESLRGAIARYASSRHHASH